ncbi:hypothetical protein C8Q72DRAFT_807297 [Fomitopsis betulina]|nr:hypothetical protein C8Q72DRAFT_807297 [Fomitopsis betulina]
MMGDIDSLVTSRTRLARLIWSAFVIVCWDVVLCIRLRWTVDAWASYAGVALVFPIRYQLIWSVACPMNEVYKRFLLEYIGWRSRN